MRRKSHGRADAAHASRAVPCGSMRVALFARADDMIIHAFYSVRTFGKRCLMSRPRRNVPVISEVYKINQQD